MVEYTIQKSFRAKQVRITVRANGRVVVTQPMRASVSFVRRCVESHTDWIIEKTKKINERQGNPLLRHSRTDYLKYRETARHLVHSRLSHYNLHYKFTYNTVSIKNLTSRWGSCSRQRNLNFNYKIVFLPKEVQDYIIVHELCHLAELNHGSRFWSLVREQIPGADLIKKDLRKIY